MHTLARPLSYRENQFSEAVESILASVDRHTIGLIEKVEETSAGHLFGIKKAAHMRVMSRKGYAAAMEEGFSPELADLARIVFRCHDLGRHIEIIRGLDPMRGDNRHGELSVEFLKQNNLLDALSPDQQATVVSAIREHCLPQMTLDRGTPAGKLCQLLRDYDTLELLRNVDGFYRGRGLLRELETHVLPKALGHLVGPEESNDVLREALGSRESRRKLEEYVEAVLSNRPGLIDPPSGHESYGFRMVAAASAAFLNGKESPELWKAGIERRPISTCAVKSAADAAVLQLMSIFNIHSLSPLREVATRGLLAPRFATVGRVNGALSTNLVLWIDQHMSERLRIPTSELSRLRLERGGIARRAVI